MLHPFPRQRMMTKDLKHCRNTSSSSAVSSMGEAWGYCRPWLGFDLLFLKTHVQNWTSESSPYCGSACHHHHHWIPFNILQTYSGLSARETSLEPQKPIRCLCLEKSDYVPTPWADVWSTWDLEKSYHLLWKWVQACAMQNWRFWLGLTCVQVLVFLPSAFLPRTIVHIFNSHS